ncbi:leucine-rich repeat-containing protein 74A-like [Mercenaria mercenaria]|uniref:leucine-rich repeat-containing protein 74A-like n=1 Tax=Mercenaria mercenaria TaxID=6596 RepID=UPI00234EF046|nr:leucine-rich repeat-containing protein 74A-like [Mercenaria mercenaria]
MFTSRTPSTRDFVSESTTITIGDSTADSMTKSQFTLMDSVYRRLQQVDDDRSRKALARKLKDKYERACKVAKKYPLKCILDQFENTTFDLAGKRVGPEHMKLAAITLLKNEYVNELDLRDNSLGDEGIFYVTDLLPHNIYITRLNLAENNIGIPGLKAIIQTVMDNILIVRLDISGLRDTQQLNLKCTKCLLLKWNNQ